MTKDFPSIGQYNYAVQKFKGDVFVKLKGIELIPSRKHPVTVYLFGSGTYAAVFKGSLNGFNYAIRCFLSASDKTLNRYEAICSYLKNINSEWITDCELIKDEILINEQFFPILKMEWIDGVLINQFISKYIGDNNVLSLLQSKLVEVSDDLEKNLIGHGDLQCGNIIVHGDSSHFQIKLIDYDGMFVPEFENKKGLENGRSEFQHPKRKKGNFNHKMDRFSFWVMLTAIEAIKHEKFLWREVMQGGFNTLDNFLFTIQDFLNPNQSKLFKILYGIKSDSLNYYLDNLKSSCLGDYSDICKPALAEIITENILALKVPNSKYVESIDPTIDKKNISDSTPIDKYKIITRNGSAVVLSSTFQKIGTTPLLLDKNKFNNKLILISNGIETKRVHLNTKDNIIVVEFN